MNDVMTLLRDCLVQVCSAKEREASFGTGFFVAPRRVLTCGHVVSELGTNIVILWRDVRLTVKANPVMFPPAGGSHRYHLLPDLAVLELIQPLDHPSVWLADGPPLRGAAVTAVGYNRWITPRTTETGLVSATLSEVRLNFVGLDGDCWRVTGDDLTGGMSGGPVLDMATGRVAAMLKAKIDPERRRAAGGWVVGVDLIAAELGDLVAENAVSHPLISRWRAVATRRADVMRKAFGDRRDVDDGKSARLRRPSWWLNPHNHVVPFVPPPEFKELFGHWCLAEASDVPQVRLLHAPGGVGKTRLSLELADKLGRLGWVSGVVASDQAMASFIHSLPALWRGGHSVFCAIDYAETSLDAVKRLFESLNRHRVGHVRILLLARSAGNWWKALAPQDSAPEFIEPTPLTLRDIGHEDPVGIATAAYRSFCSEVLGDNEGESRPIPESLRVAAASHRRALDLHAAALVHVLNISDASLVSGDPLDALLDHERAYWRRAAAAQAGVTFTDVDRLSDRLLAVPTLCPNVDALSAEQVIAQLPGSGETLPCSAEHLATTLAHIYPGDEGRYWSPLIPDRVGERLVAAVIMAHPSALRAAEEFVRLVGEADGTQAAHIITVLGRVAGLTDPTPVPQDVSDRAYALITSLASHNPLAFGGLADQMLALAASRGAATRSSTQAVRHPLCAGRGITSFSNTANIMGVAYATWLGAAFSAGGLSGYDYRALGITARGAWESVERRLSTAGVDIHAHDITVVGIGDMSGDVFGNGMLRSRRIRLIAAFDHRHIFLDPDPDSVASYDERKRLFEALVSSWADYDRASISPGGGVWSRTSNSIPVSSEARAALGVSALRRDVAVHGNDDLQVEMKPAELIKAILQAPVDLLWNGGIGTYVKAAIESDVGDPSNDHVRVDAKDLACRVVGEAGSAGLTQRGRIEYAMKGGSVAADFIDGSAGLAFFDRELGVKILLGTAVAEGILDRNERVGLLADAADDIAATVFRDSRDQVNVLSVDVAESRTMLPVHRRTIVDLERRNQLDRSVEGMPDDLELAGRSRAGLGLTMPELATLLAHVKILVARELAESRLPDEDWANTILVDYFPASLRLLFAHLMADHPLRREMVATQLANEVVNRGGVSFFFRAMEETGADAADVAAAYLIVRDVFGLTELWEAVDDLKGTSAEAQVAAYLHIRELLGWAVYWILASKRLPIDAANETRRLRPPVAQLFPELKSLLGDADSGTLRSDIEALRSLGLPSVLAGRVSSVKHAFGLLDVVELATTTGRDLKEVALVYFVLSRRLRAPALLTMISALPRDDQWQARARTRLHMQLRDALAAVTVKVLTFTGAMDSPDNRVLHWEQANGAAISRTSELFGDFEGSRDLPALIVLLRAIRSLAGTSESSVRP